MGYSGKLQEKLLAQNLRKKGYSYQQILQSIHVSKGTLSTWCKDIELTAEQKQELILKKRFGQRKGSLIAAENKKKIRKEKISEIFNKAAEDIKDISQRDKFMLGISLYAAEGDKTDKKGGFTNSDPNLIFFMKEWFNDFLNLPAERYRGALWIHEGSDVERAEEFWAKLTKIPKSQFHKTYIARNKTDSNKVRKRIHEHGIFAIRFSDSYSHRKIMGWISHIFNARISTHSAIAQR